MTTRARFAAACVAVALVACGDDEVDPITKIESSRVLAITTEPSTMALEGEMALDVLVVDEEGPRTGVAGERPVDAIRLRACAPWKFVVDPARDCAGDDAISLEIDDTGRFTTSAAALAEAFPAPPGTTAPPDPWRAALAAGLELRVPLIAEIDVGGQTLVAKRDVEVVHTADGEAIRQNPRVVDIRFDGAPTRTLRAGQRYTMTAAIDRTSLDAAVEPETEGELETVRCFFFATAGDIAEAEVVADADEPEPITDDNTFTAGSSGTAWLFLVALDETGGMSTTSIELAIEP